LGDEGVEVFVGHAEAVNVEFEMPIDEILADLIKVMF